MAVSSPGASQPQLSSTKGSYTYGALLCNTSIAVQHELTFLTLGFNGAICTQVEQRGQLTVSSRRTPNVTITPYQRLWPSSRCSLCCSESWMCWQATPRSNSQGHVTSKAPLAHDARYSARVLDAHAAHAAHAAHNSNTQPEPTSDTAAAYKTEPDLTQRRQGREAGGTVVSRAAGMAEIMPRKLGTTNATRSANNIPDCDETAMNV